MPKNKFDSFYYGIGIKLDEASVDAAGKKLEGKLNTVVDNISKNLTQISDAVAKGVKDVDTKKLVQSIVDAQRELQHFQDFNPKQLQQQIGDITTTVETLSTSLGSVTTQLKSFTDDVTSRLSNIEIKTSKQGIDALKDDLGLMEDFARRMSKSGEIDTAGLDKYFRRVRDGFASIKASGNPMELFADKDIAKLFVNITNILQQMGAPVEDLRSQFFELSSTFKNVFEKTDSVGSKSIFKDVGYQIESVSTQLKQAIAELEIYKSKIKELDHRRQSTGFAVASEDKGLDFDKKIEKIQKYEDLMYEFDPGTEQWYETLKKQIALIQSAEKELMSLSKGANGAQYMEKWKKAFSGFDLEDKFSTEQLARYKQQAHNDMVELGKIYTEAYNTVKTHRTRLEALTGKKVTTKKDKAAATTAVDLKARVNEGEWIKTINAALTSIESKKKVKPFKIQVQATQGKILQEIQKIKEATLMDKKNNGEKDVVRFNNNFDKFIKNLQSRKQELINELKQNWHPALRDAFAFKIEVLGLDKKPMTENIANNLLPAPISILISFNFDLISSTNASILLWNMIGLFSIMLLM